MPETKSRESASPANDGGDGEILAEEQISNFQPEWCQKILNDSSYKQIPTYTRQEKPELDPTFNNLMRKTLFTASTVRALKYFYTAGEPPNPGRLLALVSLGGEMCGHVNTLHGSINTLLVDEIGGALAWTEWPNWMMTVNFNVNMRRPVRTPGLLLGRAWIEKPREGRKRWIRVILEQDGQVCIDAESLFVAIKPSEKL